MVHGKGVQVRYNLTSWDVVEIASKLSNMSGLWESLLREYK